MPANLSGGAVEDDPSAWAPFICVGGLDRIQATGFGLAQPNPSLDDHFESEWAHGRSLSSCPPPQLSFK